ncbi:MAG TPA: tubulin-like doman-containing protein [Thermoleophilaceae bacterium]|jgi:hypothetical protein
MLQKYLLIGVGGSGGKTLRYTWRELDRRLAAVKWRAGVPKAWRFLHIDVPEYPDVVEGDVPADIGPDARYLGLAESPRQYWQYDDELARQTDLLRSVAGWRPDPRLDYSPPFKGAGQRRVVGRVVTLTQLDDVGEAINREVSALRSNAVDAELAELNRHLGQAGPAQDDPTAVVISSLGGGAGSGALLDIIELLKSRATEQAQWLDNSLTTILYASDVFSHLAPERRVGVEPNSLAAVSELIAAFEHEGAVNDDEARLLQKGGGALPIRGRRTGMFNFLIGAKNESVTFRTSLDVFTAVGKALAALIANESIRSQFSAYTQANWSGRPVMEDFTITDHDRYTHAASSFGYANVSLGRSLFERYATERLAKRALDRLLRGHRPTSGELRREETLIAERAEAVKESFFDDSGLWELSTSHNQVLDALRDRAGKASALDRVAANVSARLRDDRRELNSREWFQNFTLLFDDAARDYQNDEQADRTRSAEQWVENIQNRVQATVARYIGMHGLPVTIELLSLLQQQVSDAASELEHEASRFDAQETGLLNHAEQLFRAIGKRLITPQHDSFATATQERRDALQRRTESDLFSFTAELLRDLNAGFLPALRRAVESAHGTLVQGEAGEHRGLVEQWSGRVVPAHLRPAPNEVLLESIDDFPGELDRLLEAAFEIDAARDAESSALTEIISGAWSAPDSRLDRTGQRLIERLSKWRPSVNLAREPGAGAGTASFAITLDPVRLYAAAESWVRERPGPVAQHVSASLAEWLSIELPDAAARAAKFADAFDRALRNAAPLISINPDTYRLVHGGDVPSAHVTVSDLPIGADHPACARLEESLRAAHAEQPFERVFNPGSSANEIEISSYVGSSVYPIVFDSLMAPIHRDWLSRSNASGRSHFWQFRRARTLAAFVPVAPWRRRALARGWLTATMLAQVPFLVGEWSTSPLSVWTPRGWERFPAHLLGDEVTENGAVFPALMESLPLALLSFASGQRGELLAYQRLIELGVPGGGPGDEYQRANRELVQWVVNGTTVPAQTGFDAAPTPNESIAGAPANSPADRAELMVKTMREYEGAYDREVASLPVTLESTLTLGRGWELRDDIMRAASSLADAIGQIPVNGDDQGPFLTPSAR